MDSKSCFKCGATKPLDAFYAHPGMADGRIGKCKECNKKDVRENYAARRAQYHAYEARRNALESRKTQLAESTRRARAAHPDKYRARTALNNAVRDGRVIKAPCQCGCLEVEGHHHDYSKPLDVEWLCFRCHRAEHGQVTS